MEKKNSVLLILLHLLVHVICLGTFFIFAHLMLKGINISGVKFREEFESKVACMERDNQIELFGYYDETRTTLKIEEIDGYDDYVSSKSTWNLGQMIWILPLALSIGGYVLFIFYFYGDGDYGK